MNTLKLDTSTRQEIGKRLREARESNHLTQADVATKARITTSYYARVERGEEQPSLAAIKELIKALKIKSSDILPF